MGLKILSTEEDQILGNAITMFGGKHQTLKAIEECNELIAELRNVYILVLHDNELSNLDLAGLAEEIADVQIMCRQMAMAYNVRSRVDMYTDLKLHKLDETLTREVER